MENEELLLPNGKMYFYKNQNTGPGLTRNEAGKYASGNYLLFLDSDTIIPPDYIANVRKKLSENYTDAFGGADAADSSFSSLQKAISYSMTSFLITWPLGPFVFFKSHRKSPLLFV